MKNKNIILAILAIAVLVWWFFIRKKPAANTARIEGVNMDTPIREVEIGGGVIGGATEALESIRPEGTTSPTEYTSIRLNPYTSGPAPTTQPAPTTVRTSTTLVSNPISITPTLQTTATR